MKLKREQIIIILLVGLVIYFLLNKIGQERRSDQVAGENTASGNGTSNGVLNGGTTTSTGVSNGGTTTSTSTGRPSIKDIKSGNVNTAMATQPDQPAVGVSTGVSTGTSGTSTGFTSTGNTATTIGGLPTASRSSCCNPLSSNYDSTCPSDSDCICDNTLCNQISTRSGCCNSTRQNYDSTCQNDPNCYCDPKLCGNPISITNPVGVVNQGFPSTQSTTPTAISGGIGVARNKNLGGGVMANPIIRPSNPFTPINP